jgi:hypothetical protein
MDERLSALFELKLEKVQQEMEKQSGEIKTLRSVVTRVESDNTLLKLDNARLLTDLNEVQHDLRILHPLPYARLYLQECIKHQIARNDAVNAFIELHTLPLIYSTPPLTLHLQELNKDLKKAWDARFAAAFLCEPPPTLDKVLWIVAKSGYTREVASMMNLSKATRGCKNLQRVMREVMNWREYGRGRRTQLNYYCFKGMISSVKRMLEMKSIDVEAREGGEEGRSSCLKIAACKGHLDICRLLIDKGAQVNTKDEVGSTPLHYAAMHGRIEIVRLLCDHGADIEASDNDGCTPLHFATLNGNISVVKELIEVRNADINARNVNGRTALRWAREEGKDDIAAFLVSHGANDEEEEEEEEGNSDDDEDRDEEEGNSDNDEDQQDFLDFIQDDNDSED